MKALPGRKETTSNPTAGLLAACAPEISGAAVKSLSFRDTPTDGAAPGGTTRTIEDGRQSALGGQRIGSPTAPVVIVESSDPESCMRGRWRRARRAPRSSRPPPELRLRQERAPGAPLSHLPPRLPPPGPRRAGPGPDATDGLATVASRNPSSCNATATVRAALPAGLVSPGGG